MVTISERKFQTPNSGYEYIPILTLREDFFDMEKCTPLQQYVNSLVSVSGIGIYTLGIALKIKNSEIISREINYIYQRNIVSKFLI